MAYKTTLYLCDHVRKNGPCNLVTKCLCDHGEPHMRRDSDGEYMLCSTPCYFTGATCSKIIPKKEVSV